MMIFFIALMVLIMMIHSWLDYLNYQYIKNDSRLRIFVRNGMIRIWVAGFTIWVLINHSQLSDYRKLLILVGGLLIGFVLIGVSTKRWSLKTLPIYVLYELKQFLKNAFSIGIVAFVLYVVFETRVFSSLWQVMFFSLTALVMIYLVLYKVILPRLFKFIPYRMRKEETLLFSQYPHIDDTVFMAQSKKIRLPMNALFMAGIKNLRVVLSDRLLARLSSEEIKGIVAHELGHGAKRHLWVRAMAMVLMIGIYLAIGQIVFETNWIEQTFSQFGFIESLFVLMVMLYSVENIVLITLYQLTQYQEYQSDRYALNLGYGLALASALEKIHRYQPDPKEHPLSKKLSLSHPDTLLRVKFLKDGVFK